MSEQQRWVSDVREFVHDAHLRGLDLLDDGEADMELPAQRIEVQRLWFHLQSIVASLSSLDERVTREDTRDAAEAGTEQEHG